MPEPVDKAAKTAVIVLGGHRSGTSCVAGVVATLGIPPALPGDEIGPSRSNRRGHFEDATLCRLHERMLGCGGWRNPSPSDDVPEPLQQAYDAHLRARAAAADRWCVKDPRLNFLLPLLMARLRALEISHCVVSVVRRPESAAESLRCRQRMSRDAALRIAWMYEGARRAQLAAVRASSRVPVLTLGYDELVNEPAAGVGLLAEFLGVRLTQDAVAFLEPGLRHF